MGESELGVDEGHNKERWGRQEEEEQKFVLNGHQIMVDEVNSRFPSQQQESQLCLPRCGCYGIWGESLP